MIAVNHLFSERLFDIGLSLAGLEIKQSFEIDSVCCETQKEIILRMKSKECDITKKLVFDRIKSDVMVATYLHKILNSRQSTRTRTG